MVLHICLFVIHIVPVGVWEIRIGLVFKQVQLRLVVDWGQSNICPCFVQQRSISIGIYRFGQSGGVYHRTGYIVFNLQALPAATFFGFDNDDTS
ncbi:hypothetical protein D3C87_1611460 [compost metagenome]